MPSIAGAVQEALDFVREWYVRAIRQGDDAALATLAKVLSRVELERIVHAASPGSVTGSSTFERSTPGDFHRLAELRYLPTRCRAAGGSGPPARITSSGHWRPFRRIVSYSTMGPLERGYNLDLPGDELVLRPPLDLEWLGFTYTAPGPVWCTQWCGFTVTTEHLDDSLYQPEMDSDAFYIVTLIQQGSYRAALAAYSELASPSETLSLYAARSHLALSPPDTQSALSLLSSLPPTLDTRAVSALATYLAGETEQAVGDLEELLAELGEQGLEQDGQGEGRLVRAVVGTVWILEGDEQRREEGVEVLREAVELGHDQECLGLLSHLYISLNLAPLSTSLLTSPSTTAITSDSLLSQLLIARSHLATGPTQKYQDAYYVFEEIKNMQGGRGEGVLSGVGVAQATLERWEEARDAVNEGLEMNPTHPTLLANAVALALHTGKTQAQADELLAQLRSADAHHPLVQDLEAKSALFDDAAAQFQPSVAAASA
ncbi:hypothetical protein BMF94_3352 [Rhodotorula taiwanensis]|uniref:Coatomer subunit epsilon n=1 Tax=Rhodotorula taiwanensis TaxID=741276 RepID=A0A2S5BAQ6_9BASI|nr:hypothetical protein BMF94_3352 [Rhodotorula taiwanensis]